MRLLPFLIVAGLGLGLGYGVSQVAFEDPDESWQPGVPAAAPERSERTDAPTIEGASTAFPDPLDATSVDARLQRVLSTIPEIAVGGPVGSIAGAAVDRDGEPLRGLTVYAEAAGAPPGWQLVDLIQDDFETYVRKRVAQHQYASALHFQALTDEDGRFRFDDLPLAVYQMRCEGRDGAFEITVDGKDRRFATPGRWVDIRETGAVDLTLDVRLPDGTQPAEATILLAPSRGGPETWTPEDATVSSTAGSVMITARVEGVGSATLPPMSFAPGSAVGPIRVDLLGESSLTIVADLPNGVSRGEAHFHVMYGAAGATPEAAELLRRGLKTQANKWSAQQEPKTGRMALVPGHYWIGAGYTEHEINTIVSVEVGDRPVTKTVTLPAIEASRSVRIVVLDPEGRPDLRGRVRLHVEGYHDTPDAVREEDGGWIFPLSPKLAEWVDAGLVSAVADSSQYGTARVVLRGQEETVQLAPAALVAVELVGMIEGRDYRLQLTGEDGHSGSIDVDTRDDDLESAMARLSGSIERLTGGVGEGRTAFQPGTYQLSVHEEYSVVHREEVRLVAGNQDLRVSLPPRNTVRIRFPSDFDESEVMMYSSTLGMALDAEIVNGVAEFQGVLAGLYQIHCSLGLMSVRVEGDVDTVFTELVPNAFEVVQVEFEGDGEPPAWLAQFQVGDYVVAIDGKRFDGMEELEKVGRELGLRAMVELTLLRGGVESVVKVPTEGLFGEGLSIVLTRL